MIKMMETQIPQNYSSTLYNEKGYDLERDATSIVADILFTGVAKCLGDVKKVEQPVAFVFVENNEDFIAGSVIQYMPNKDDASKPGSWNYSWTWYKDDVPSNARILYATDPQLSSYFRGVSQSKYGIQFKDTAAINELLRTLLAVIKKWLDENASESEEVGVEQEGLFQATVAVEDGEKVFSLVPEGEIKKLIKDDSEIEL